MNTPTYTINMIIIPILIYKFNMEYKVSRKTYCTQGLGLGLCEVMVRGSLKSLLTSGYEESMYYTLPFISYLLYD